MAVHGTGSWRSEFVVDGGGVELNFDADALDRDRVTVGVFCSVGQKPLPYRVKVQRRNVGRRAGGLRRCGRFPDERDAARSPGGL